jgi:hypothetical protein
MPVTDAESLVGTWEGIKGSGDFVRFYDDGTWRFHGDLAGLEVEPIVIGDYWFEEGRLLITETFHAETLITNACPDITGSYDVLSLPDGNLRFGGAEDDCTARRRWLQGTPEYDIEVEFRPVGQVAAEVGGEPAAEPTPVTRADDIAGTWTRSLLPVERQFNSDGTLTWEDTVTGEFWFEAGQFFIADDVPACEGTVGSYEVELLASGGLTFFAIEDECIPRRADLEGSGIPVEWMPAP